MFHKLFGEYIPPTYKNWATVAIKQGEIAIPNPEEIVELDYQSSTRECSHIINSLKER